MKRTPWLWILLCATLVGSCVVQGQDFGKLSLSPAAVYLTAEPRLYEGSFEIANGGTEAAEIEIALMDFSITPNGGFQTVPVGTRGENSLAPYITYTPTEAVLEPGEKVVVQYTIELPDGALGPLWGTLLVSPIEGEMVGGEASESGGSTLGVRVKFVHPFAILVHASGAPLPQASIVDSTIEMGDYQGHPVVVARTNVGNACTDFLRCMVTFTLYDETGALVDLSADPYPRAILPGETREFGALFLATNLAPGAYTVIAEIDYGGTEILTTMRTLEIGSS